MDGPIVPEVFVVLRPSQTVGKPLRRVVDHRLYFRRNRLIAAPQVLEGLLFFRLILPAFYREKPFLSFAGRHRLLLRRRRTGEYQRYNGRSLAAANSKLHCGILRSRKRQVAETQTGMDWQPDVVFADDT